MHCCRVQFGVCSTISLSRNICLFVVVLCQLYHGGDMVIEMSLHFYQLKESLTSHTIYV